MSAALRMCVSAGMGMGVCPCVCMNGCMHTCACMSVRLYGGIGLWRSTYNVFVCVHVCIPGRICSCVSVYAYTYKYIYIHTDMYICMHACMLVCVCVFACKHVLVCMCVCRCRCKSEHEYDVPMCVCIYLRLVVCLYVCMPACMLVLCQIARDSHSLGGAHAWRNFCDFCEAYITTDFCGWAFVTPTMELAIACGTTNAQQLAPSVAPHGALAEATLAMTSGGPIESLCVEARAPTLCRN